MKDALHRSPKKTRLNWKLQKRRFQFQLLTNFGKEMPSSDEMYEQHEQRFLALLQKLLDIRKSLEHYRTKALPEYCAACATLGADVWCVVSVDAVGKGTDAERFRHAMCAINETKEMKSHYFNADEVLSGALRFLDIHINAMKSVASQIEGRKRVKLDYDCYERKVAKLVESKPMTSKQLERNRSKLQQAKDALQAITFDLYRVFAKYESERDTMLNGELEMVRQVMNGFYGKNAEATSFTIKEELDRAAIEARTEQIYKHMVAKELERDLSRCTSTFSACAQVAPMSIPIDLHHHSSWTAMPPPAPSSANAASVPPTDHQSPEQMLPPDSKEPQERLSVHQLAEDELAEKLRTIQLSRPKMPPLRHFKGKHVPNNQVEAPNNR